MPVPRQFISELHSHKSCTEFLHEFLDIIQLDMMIIKTRDRGRINCGELHQRLLDMVQHCECDADYASKPAPRSRNELERRPIEVAVEANLAQLAAEALGKDLLVQNGPTRRTFMPASRTVPVGCET